MNYNTKQPYNPQNACASCLLPVTANRHGYIRCLDSMATIMLVCSVESTFYMSTWIH